MTFRERWIQEHPRGDINDVVITRCPAYFGYEGETFRQKCRHSDITCAQCWDREIPEEATSVTNEPIVKEITYTKVPMDRDDLAEFGLENLCKDIERARLEALKRGIEANAVIINKNLVHVPTDFMNFPDMICGLDVQFTSKELPDKYYFAVLHLPNTKNDRLKRFESIGMEPEELKKAAELYKSIKEKLCDGSTDI